MAMVSSFARALVAVGVSAAWFYATLALCVATYTATAALVSLLVAMCSFCVILCAPGSELPQYAPLEGAASRVLALAPARRLVELWSLGPTVGFVVALVAVSADGRFHTAFALLVLAAVVVLTVPALGGEGVIVAAFTTTTWWMAFCFYQIEQTGVSLIAVGVGPPLGLLVCAAARLIAAATRGARRCVGRGALLLPPLLLLLALAPVYRSLRPVEKSAAPKVAERAPDAKSFVTGAHFLKLEAAAKVPRAPNGVPRVVHQTWRSHKMRPDHRAMFDSWSRCLPQGWLHVSLTWSNPAPNLHLSPNPNPHPNLNPGPTPSSNPSPNPTQVLWTDAEVEGFVKARAPPAFVRTFARYKLPIQRIDTFRYVLMATVGGMYADLDNECVAAPELPDVNLTAAQGGCRAYVATQACTDTFL